MRIISQDGTCDYPYEQIGISIGHNANKTKWYIFWNSAQEQIGCEIAMYSTKAKAQKAMEMLREVYSFGKKVEFPQFSEDGIAEDDSITLFNTMLLNRNRKFRIDEKYFRFPADDEVEGKDE